MRRLSAFIVGAAVKLGVGAFGVVLVVVLFTAAFIGAGTLAKQSELSDGKAIIAATVVSLLLIPPVLVFARSLSKSAAEVTARTDQSILGPPVDPAAGQLSRPDPAGDLSFVKKTDE